MKFFVIARHGLGDVISGIFIANRGRMVLSKLWDAMEKGAVDDCVLLYEEHYNKHIPEIFLDMPFKLRVEPTRLLGDNLGLHHLVSAGGNYMPPAVGDHLNVWDHIHLLSSFDGSRHIQITVRKPKIDLPEKYILFCPYASAVDRELTHECIYKGIKSTTDLPVISVGFPPGNNIPRDSVRGDIDMIRKTTVAETLYLAKHSECVVGAASWYRCCNSLFDKPVIEIYEVFRNPPSVIASTLCRTLGEMSTGQYGIRHDLHCILPMSGDPPDVAVGQALKRYLDKQYIKGTC